MADKNAKAKSSKVKTRPFKIWAKERGQVPTSLGAAVAFDIDENAEITETEFVKYLDDYGKQGSAIK